MQIQRNLVSKLLHGEPSSPLLLEGYNFLNLTTLVKSEIVADPREPLVIFSDQTTATMDGVRDLISRLHKKGHSRRYVLLERAHKFRKDTANALLKLLEEPPLDTHLILTALPYALIPTIRSRCSIIKFLHQEQIVEQDSQNLAAPLAQRFQQINDSNPQEVAALLENFIVEARKNLLQETTPAKAIKKGEVLNRALDILQKGVYSKISLQNIFTLWRYA